jgi:hypothetical protein
VLFKPKNSLDSMAAKLNGVSEPQSTLFADIVAKCDRVLVLKTAGKTRRLERLIDAGAWTDAVLELIALEASNWKVRRLMYDEERWHCSLSKHPEMPIEFDDVIEAAHECPALAILAAFVELLRREPNDRASLAQPLVGAETSDTIRVCCENFS